MKAHLSLGLKIAWITSAVLAAIVIFSVLLAFGPLIDLPQLTPTTFMIGLAMIVVLVTSVTVIFLAHIFVDRPLKELMTLMAQAKKTNYLARAPVRSTDVIGRLAKSYNEMLKRITTLGAEQLETERELEATQSELAYQKNLSLLHDVGKTLSASIEFDDLYINLKQVIGDRLGFQEFAIMIYDETSEELVLKVAHGLENVVGMHFQVGEGISGFVYQTGETFYIQDTGQEPRYLRYKGERLEEVAFLCLPLCWKEKVLGVMNFSRPKKEGFSEDDITFLKAIANHVALAVANAKLYAQTKELAIRDELTGLYNRRHLMYSLNLELKRAQRFQRRLSLLMIDVDHFKKYNDTYGHLQGDEVLKQLGALLLANLREVDFVARYGGEEFVIYLPNTSKEDGGLVASKILQKVRTHAFHEGENPPHITVSAGVAAFPEDALEGEPLIDCADDALYQAKKAGRDRCVVESSQSKMVSPMPA